MPPLSPEEIAKRLTEYSEIDLAFVDTCSEAEAAMLRENAEWHKAAAAEVDRLRALVAEQGAKIARADALAAAVQHALTLGYLGEGSTAGYARDALRDYLGEGPDSEGSE